MNFAQVKGISIPQGSVKQLAQGQTVLWKKGSSLPYDARVTFLECDGNAYIDTGVNLRAICKASYGIELSAVPSSVSVPYGIYWDAYGGPRNQAAYINGGTWRDTSTTYTNTTGVSTGQTVQASLPYDITATNKNTYANDNTNYFFARHNDGGSPLPVRYMRGRYLTVEVAGAWVKDAYPVRVGQVGYFYDRVSGLLMPNIGGGAFTLGADTPCTVSKLAQEAMTQQMQGLAIYGDKLVRMNNGTDGRVYQISAVGGLSLLASFTVSTGHHNSLQFAPTLAEGQTFPYLYATSFTPARCDVFELSAAYSATLVQTISHDIASIPSGCNLQIGDDGHIWGAYLDGNDHYHFMKFRQVAVGEGSAVTIHSSDILDEWSTAETYPYASYVWQGMKVKNGRIWFVHAAHGSSQHRGVAIYNCGTHAHVGTWDLSYYDEEYEDMDVWNDGWLVGTWSTSEYRITHD